MITLSEIKISYPQKSETAAEKQSIGLVIPFQPSMVDKKTIKSILNYTLEEVQCRLENEYQPEDIRHVIDNLKKIFNRLNYNSHRKSVAIIVKPDEEKIIYLNYSGNPVFYLDDRFSLLDLVGNSVREPEFELLWIKNNGAELHEYFNNSLHKVFSQTSALCDEDTNNECLMQRISAIVKLVNRNNDKPVFLYSEDDQQTNKFFEIFPYKNILFKLNLFEKQEHDKPTDVLVQKILSRWPHWQSMLVRGQITLAKKNQTIFSHLNSVTKALKYYNNGILLIDEFMKQEIHQNLEDENSFDATKKLTDEIEKFLARGNRIEITEGGLLETLGGIALIKNNDTVYASVGFSGRYKEEGFLF
jgi:hypothetical protein